MIFYTNIILPTIDGQQIDHLCNQFDEKYDGLPLYSSYGITMYDVDKYISQRNADIRTYSLTDECVNNTFKWVSYIGIALLTLTCYLTIKIFFLQLLLMVAAPALFYFILQHYCIKRLVLSHYDSRIEQFIKDVTKFAKEYELKRIHERKNSTFKSICQKGNAVDLGLSVYWSDSNIGAYCEGWSNECELSCECDYYGSYFDWGETGPNQSFSLMNVGLPELLRNKIINNDRTLSEQYDAASVNWGNPWRMPTYEEVQELICQCRWEKGNLEGHDGCWVIGPNGNRIFLPFGGSRRLGEVSSKDRLGIYWIGQLKRANDDVANALILNIGHNNVDIDSHTALFPRNEGCSVRAVADKGTITAKSDLYEAFDF